MTSGPALMAPLRLSMAAGLMLAASGFSALVFQVLWIKQLSLVVGVEVHAIAIGVAAFFAGLALGGAWGGPLADRSAQPLRLYAAIEAGIGLLACLATRALARSAAPFTWLEAHGGPLAWLLPVLLVMVPAVLMGATLPVMLRAMAPAAAALGRAGGGLYAANTLGAIAGALLSSFLLLPSLGVSGSAFVAGVVNLLVAGLALVLAGRVLPVPGPSAPADAAAAPAPVPASPLARRALWLYALAGGVALGYEVVWSQAIVQFMSTRAFAFSVMLATYLAGLMLGSALQARFADRLRNPWTVFGVLVAGAGLLAMGGFAVLGAWLPQWQSAAANAVGSLAYAAGATSETLPMAARFAVAAGVMVLLPTLLLGAAFPVALRLAVGADAPGRGTGRLVALNTLGGIVGTLVTGFVLVPSLGLVRSMGVLAVAAALIGAVAVLSAPRAAGAAHHWGRGVALVLVVLTAVAAALTPPDRLARLLAAERGGKLAFYEESRGGTVAVLTQRAGSHAFKRLYIQGVSNSGDAVTSLRYMRLQALLPLLVARQEPRSALVIGLGTGITAGALLQYPGLEQRVVAELLPAVARATPQFVGNFDVASDPRMQVRLRDGRRELMASSERYDLITLEPPPPSAAGVANLYSSDFYALAARRLTDGGLFAQWLPLPTQNDEDTRSLVRSFVDVFPHATLWTTELHEMLLVGSFAPIELDVPRIASRFAQPEVKAALGAVGVATPAALMATWVTDRKGLEAYVDGAPPVTDDRPRIEYASWVRHGEFGRVLPRLYAYITPPPLQGADTAFNTALSDEQKRLQGMYRAGLAAYDRDYKGWASEVRSVMREDGDNPYYRWLVGPQEVPKQ